jgi:threonine aldolase
MTEAERRSHFAACTRFLGGHYPVSVKDQLARLSEQTGASEKSDVYGAGALIEDFEKHVAELLGFASAVFMPSGTMAQNIAMRIHCDSRGSKRFAMHPTSHLELHEQKSYRELHGLNAELIGTGETLLSLKDFESSTGQYAAAIIELPQRESGGLLPKWDDLVRMSEYCRGRKILVHMDGARLWEAAPYYRKSYREICSLFDTVYVSFYKGLGGLTGAMLVGPADFIANAKIWQRRHGGNLYRLFPYVISARESLKERLPKMSVYFEKAKEIAQAIAKVPGVRVVPQVPQTNMMHIKFERAASKLETAFGEIARDEKVAMFLRLQPIDDQSCKAELSIGDAGLDLDAELVTRLMSRAMSRAAGT